MLLMFIPSIFIYLGFLGYLNYILKYPMYQSIGVFGCSRCCCIAISACCISDSLAVGHAGARSWVKLSVDGRDRAWPAVGLVLVIPRPCR
jgi:hypothetical protein